MQTNNTDTHKYTCTSSHIPFLEEMSLASSSLRLARESASSSARGRSFSWGAERLCWRWGSPKLWVSASRRATQHRQRHVQEQMSDMDTYCDIINESACLSPPRGDKCVPSEAADMERWPSSRGWEEKGSPKQLVHKTASTTHTHKAVVILSNQREREGREKHIGEV